MGLAPVSPPRAAQQAHALQAVTRCDAAAARGVAQEAQAVQRSTPEAVIQSRRRRIAGKAMTASPAPSSSHCFGSGTAVTAVTVTVPVTSL